jgi:SAM-dependent methyltransferase
MASQDYLEINKNSWNKRTDVHVTSEFYDQEAFLKGANSLKSIEMALLPDLNGKRLLHLQCHFGQDTMSLARMGASCVGLDLSDRSVDVANETAQKLNLDARFVCADVYSAPEVIDEQFDVVFTTYGTIGWLPDINRWAEVVSSILKPGGIFVFAEFHPVMWMYDDDLTHVKYRYFNSEVIQEVEEGTYAQKESDIRVEFMSWNHGLAETINSLLDAGLALTSFSEHDYSPYNVFPESYEFEPGKFRTKVFEDKVPMVYSLTAQKPE